MEILKKKIEEAVNIYKSGNLTKAEAICKNLISKNPKIPFLYNLLGLISVSLRKIDDAIKYYQIGLKIDPNFAMIYNNIGLIYYEKQSLVINNKKNADKAEFFFKKSIEVEDKNPLSYTNLGNLYNRLNKLDQAINCHKKAIELNQQFYQAYLNLANVYISIGDYNFAKKYLEKSIIINKKFYLAHRLLSRIKKYTKGDKHLNELINLYDDTKDDDILNKSNLGFALGKAYEDIKNFKKSFFYYKNANMLFRKKINYSFKEEKNKFNEIKKTYNRELFKKLKNKGYKNASPIFIVGMPRSGTTLVEQIISTHPHVYGCDEINLLPQLVSKYFKNNDINLFLQGILDLNVSDLKKMGDDYNKLITNISYNSERATDKLPINFLSIGLIKLILPNAKIINCFRNPKDNIFSIYKNHFPVSNMNFAYNVSEIVDYFNLYNSLMIHWNNLLPHFVYNIKYENLVSDSEKFIRELLNYCNLNWNSKCLKFYENNRPIKTASDTQVRSKMYKNSINSWKNYEEFLKEEFVNLS